MLVSNLNLTVDDFGLMGVKGFQVRVNVRVEIFRVYNTVKHVTKIRRNIVGFKSLHEVTVVKVRITAAKLNLVVFSNLDENYAK
uniref:Uncharacterized protein n=1 Tax=Tanacetum cinerariifolium TaxID=118510 RepID=A0A699HID2_TANCI|nr:hypothetical protein [Tanacetum cinerariifolium]